MQRNTKQQKIDPFGNITYGSLAKEEIAVFIGGTDKPVCVETVGITHPDPSYSIERKHCDYFVFEYVVSGTGYIYDGNNTYTVRAGDVYILEKGSHHKYWADKRDPFEKIWINFFGDVFAGVLSAYGLSGKTVFNGRGCERYFSEIVQIARNNFFSDEVCYDVAPLLFRIVNTIAENRAEGQSASVTAKQIKARLDGALYGSVTVEAVAKELLVSKAQLTREFSKYYGVTPYRYYIERKLDLAKKLLRTTNMRVGEIAETLCFADEHYFSGLFKSKTGASPLAYRHAAGAGASPPPPNCRRLIKPARRTAGKR